MSTVLQLWKEDTLTAGGMTTARAVVEYPDAKRRTLWYRVPERWKPWVTESCDPFVVATVFTAMRSGRPLRVEGEVSPSLLRNLEEFQAAWACWKPGEYTAVEMTAATEKERLHPGTTKSAVVFSGGVDSCFTAWRHRKGECGRSTRMLAAGVMVHGFDIPLEEPGVFERAAAKAAALLASLDMELLPLATNFRELDDDWDDAHGAGLASSVMVLQDGIAAGLIGSSDPYHSMILPYGSNPVTDRMLSSDTFAIIHDGASFTRCEKVRAISRWPEALRSLRVCWEGKQKDRNCGRCEKCVRTVLNFRVAGAGLPACFEREVSDAQVAGIHSIGPSQIIELEQILAAARSSGIAASWVDALEVSIERNRQGRAGRQTLLQKVKRVAQMLSA